MPAKCSSPGAPHLRAPAGRQAACRPPAGAPAPPAAPAATVHGGNPAIRFVPVTAAAWSRGTARSAAGCLLPQQLCATAVSAAPPHLQDVCHRHPKLPLLQRHPRCRQWLLLLQAGCSSGFVGRQAWGHLCRETVGSQQKARHPTRHQPSCKPDWRSRSCTPRTRTLVGSQPVRHAIQRRVGLSGFDCKRLNVGAHLHACQQGCSRVL